jgi:hypothetical protein
MLGGNLVCITPARPCPLLYVMIGAPLPITRAATFDTISHAQSQLTVKKVVGLDFMKK